MLQSSGLISLGQIRNEFSPGWTYANIGKFTRGGSYVTNLPENARIKTSNDVQAWSDYYGTRKYPRAGLTIYNVVSETKSQYANSNNGWFSVAKLGPINTGYYFYYNGIRQGAVYDEGHIHAKGGLNSGSYTIGFSDILTGYYIGFLVSIGYGGVSDINGYSSGSSFWVTPRAPR